MYLYMCMYLHMYMLPIQFYDSILYTYILSKALAFRIQFRWILSVLAHPVQRKVWMYIALNSNMLAVGSWGASSIDFIILAQTSSTVAINSATDGHK